MNKKIVNVHEIFYYSFASIIEDVSYVFRNRRDDKLMSYGIYLVRNINKKEV